MNQLYYPSDVSVASDGTIYVLDPNNGNSKWGPVAIVGTTVTNVSFHAFRSIFQEICSLILIIVFRNGLLAEHWTTVAGVVKG
jgi:hypothetical protein